MNRPTRVLCLGGGWAAFELAKSLKAAIRRNEVELTVVSRADYLATHGLMAELLTCKVQPRQAVSFFRDGAPLDYVADLLSPECLREAGVFDPLAVGRLVEKCRSGRVTGFADNQAFVGVLSTMLLHRNLREVRSLPAIEPVLDTCA